MSAQPFMKSGEIHALVDWPATLAQLGIADTFLRNKHGPCPACGGKDRFRFDNKYNKQGDGGFFCARCGAGDGFKLLMLVNGWTFAEARARVMVVAGLNGVITPARRAAARQAAAIKVAPADKAMPTERVLRPRRGCCAIEDCPDAMAYFAGRELWPLPPGCTLHAHPAVEYWEQVTDVWKIVGSFPALIADVVDIAGELVAVHVTYLHEGKKLAGHQPRKLWGKPKGWTGCAIRLMPAGAVLGIAEGIETALSAALLHGVPVWSAVDAVLLAKFDPPPGVATLLVFADRDKAGQEAADRLVERVQGRVQVEIHMPAPPAKDWNDVLITTGSNRRATGEGRSNE